MKKLATMVVALVLAVTFCGSPAMAAPTDGTGAELTDSLYQVYTGSKYSSQYHIFADGLDADKQVGLLIYADGSGEYGLKNPTSTYLLAGENGLINVAKRNNMILLTPFSPNTKCSGGGSCWYLGDPVGYANWAEELVGFIQSQYPIKKDRVAFGGYSSGAQLATEWWVPSGAAQRTMTDGVVVAISYGGSPKMEEVTYEADFQSKVHMNWNVGSKDKSYMQAGEYGVTAGHTHYTNKEFATSLDVISGLGHNRSDFGKVMEAQIKEHVIDADGGAPSPEPEPVQFPTTVQVTSREAKFLIDVPLNTTPPTYVYVHWGTGSFSYLSTTRDGDDVDVTFKNLKRNTDYTYRVLSDGTQRASGSFRTPA